MATETTTYRIIRFPNATLFERRSLDASSASGRLQLWDGDREVERDSELLSDELKSILYRKGWVAFGPAEQPRATVLETYQDVDHYEPKSSAPRGLRQLSPQEFEQLTASFRAHYELVREAPREELVELSVRIEDRPMELDPAILEGKRYLNELHNRLANVPSEGGFNRRNSAEAAVDISNFEAKALNQEQLIHVVWQLYSPVTQGRSQRGIFVGGFFGGIPSKPDSISIRFFETPYEGAMKKQLDRKKNGQPYADRRGRMVPDYPQEAGKATITRAELWEWWQNVDGNSRSDEEKIQLLKELVAAVLHVEKRVRWDPSWGKA